MGGYLVSCLNQHDFELIKQITSLSKETLEHAIALRNHSSECTDIMLDKLEQKKDEKKEQLESERNERDQIAAPSKDIWRLNERINYFQVGAKVAIMIELKGGNT